MSAGHLYHYFPSKDAIVEQMANEYLSTFSKQVHLTDISLKPFPIDRSVNDKGCDHSCVSQSCNKCRCLAMIMWEAHSQSLALETASVRT